MSGVAEEIRELYGELHKKNFMFDSQKEQTEAINGILKMLKTYIMGSHKAEEGQARTLLHVKSQMLDMEANALKLKKEIHYVLGTRPLLFFCYLRSLTSPQPVLKIIAIQAHNCDMDHLMLFVFVVNSHSITPPQKTRRRRAIILRQRRRPDTIAYSTSSARRWAASRRSSKPVKTTAARCHQSRKRY